MTTEPSENRPEEERAYWEHRVANLEIIVSELILKNERLRQELHFPANEGLSEPQMAQIVREWKSDQLESSAAETEAAFRKGY